MNANPESAPANGDVHGGAMKLVLDVSDLLAYFSHNRAPTGIQRVQMEIARRLAAAYPADEVSLTRLSEATGEWKHVAAALFDELIVASKLSASNDDPQWIQVRERIFATTLAGANTDYPPGSVLVNLGSSWWSPNYFLYIRQLKERFGVAYVPLIYDMIPIVDRESCANDLVTQFIGWAMGVMDHADYYLAISHASKKDLIAIADQLGRPILADDVGVVPLDADYRQATTITTSATRPAQVIGPFVLLVSTIEHRKNQLMALDAWRELINRHGTATVPLLVLVGKIGNQGDRVTDRLERDAQLAQRVVVLTGVDDAQLALLYEAALFTVYPSRYEGWGLPVTESLCFGKAALVARNSSLPEAGGDHVAYFDTGSLRSLTDQLEMLLFDGSALARYEAKARSFTPRSWPDISDQLRSLVLDWRRVHPTRAASSVPVAVRGGYYPLRRNASTMVWRGMDDNERFRSGNSWYLLEDWGCWARDTGAGISFTVADDEPVRLAMRVHVPGSIASEVTVLDHGHRPLASATVEPRVAKWVTMTVAPIDRRITLLLRASEVWREEGNRRLLSVGMSGLFVFTDPRGSDYELVEGVALGSLIDLDPHRRPFPDARP